MELKKRIDKTKEQAFDALMTRCAKAEICTSDARRLMSRWGVTVSDFEWVINKLIDNRFIDEQRYAEAYVRDKINFSRWGARKISDSLYQKHIPKELIDSAMQQIDGYSMITRLEVDLRRKKDSLKEGNSYKVRDKLIRFGISRGFDYEMVCELIDKIIEIQDSE